MIALFRESGTAAWWTGCDDSMGYRKKHMLYNKCVFVELTKEMICSRLDG